jgi:ornithine cyclodeaminase/alanine dehydrogenase-like protein (mu-crystallin family)
VHPGLHLNMLGADGPGKAEAELEVVERCRLFCDERYQASHGGELTGALEAGRILDDQVTELGAVLTGKAAGRIDDAQMTLFDSTGLAIQDVAICLAVLEAGHHGRIKPTRARL